MMKKKNIIKIFGRLRSGQSFKLSGSPESLKRRVTPLLKKGVDYLKVEGPGALHYKIPSSRKGARLGLIPQAGSLLFGLLMESITDSIAVRKELKRKGYIK